MRVNDPQTAEYISEYSGVVKKFSPILQLGGGIMVREIEEQAVLREDAMNLGIQEFFMFGLSGAFKGRTRTVKPPDLQVVYPEIKIALN
jgi:hypothetical protein